MHIFITITDRFIKCSVLKQKGVGKTMGYLNGRCSHKVRDGVGLHREDVDEYDAACSDKNGERRDEESGWVGVVIDQRDRVALSAA